MKALVKFSKILGILSFFSTVASAATAPSLETSLQTTLDSYRTKYHMPGVALSIKLPGTTAIQDYFSGGASLSGDPAISKDSLFQVGGVTKSFTAALILQLEAEGKLSLDDPLSKWLTQYPDWKAITLRQLLNETSGVFDYLAIPTFISELANDPKHSDLLLEDLVDMAYRHKPNLNFKIGQKWEPSNTNFALLGLVIEAATKQSFNEVLTQRLLGPSSGLTNTYYFPYPQAALSHLVHGYETDGVTDVSHFNMSWGGPAAGLISTSHDIVLWSQALFSGAVLQAKQLSEMTTLVAMKNGQPLKDGVYSMGVGLGIEAGVDAFASKYGIVYGYNANTLGYRAQFVYLPCYDLVVAVTINNVAQKPKDLTDMMSDLVKTLTSSSQWQDYKKTHTPDQLPAICKKLWS